MRTCTNRVGTCSSPGTGLQTPPLPVTLGGGLPAARVNCHPAGPLWASPRRQPPDPRNTLAPPQRRKAPFPDLGSQSCDSGSPRAPTRCPLPCVLCAADGTRLPDSGAEALPTTDCTWRWGFGGLCSWTRLRKTPSKAHESRDGVGRASACPHAQRRPSRLWWELGREGGPAAGARAGAPRRSPWNVVTSPQRQAQRSRTSHNPGGFFCARQKSLGAVCSDSWGSDAEINPPSGPWALRRPASPVVSGTQFRSSNVSAGGGLAGHLTPPTFPEPARKSSPMRGPGPARVTQQPARSEGPPSWPGRGLPVSALGPAPVRPSP